MRLNRRNSEDFYQYGLIIVMVGLGIAMGTWQEIITPTLPNLKEKLNVSYESVGRLISIRSMGNVVSLLLTGYLFDSFLLYVPFMMAGSCCMAGLITMIIPWCKQYWVVGLLFFAQSGFHKALSNGCQLTILKTFKDRSIGKMQIYHLGYSIGGIISGFICQPFLPKRISHKTKVTKYCQRKLEATEGLSSNVLGNVSNLEMATQSSFEYIYVIAGVIAIFLSLIFLAFVCFKNPMKSKTSSTDKKSWLVKISPKYIANGRNSIGFSMIILLFLYYFFYLFGLLNFIPFIVVYAIDPCKDYSMDPKNAAYLHSAVNGCFLAGRIFGSLVFDLKPTLLILLFNSFNIFFVVILLTFSHKYILALWIGACGMRFCNSIVYPTGTSYANRYIIVTSSLISIAFLGDTVGVALGQITGGYAIDNYPSYSVFYLCLGSMILLLSSTIAIVLIGQKSGLRKFSVDEKSLSNFIKDDIKKSGM